MRRVGTLILAGAVLCFMACEKEGTVGEAGKAETARSTAKIIKGPYVQDLTPTSVSIVWETDYACMGNADCRDGDNGQDIKAWGGDFTQGTSEWHIDALQPGTSYHYRVRMGQDEKEGGFTTPVAGAEKFRFIAYGDTRSRPNEHARVIKAMLPYEPEFVINTGDLVSNGKDYDAWDEQFFGPATPLMRNVPLYPCLGNHEKQAEHYFNFFSLPGNERWYSFDWGNAYFICLDTNVDFGPESEQYKWLVKDLSRVETAAWKIAFFHHPMYSYTPKRRGQREKVREALECLFFEHDVDIVFNGHDHYYERTKPMVKTGADFKSVPVGGPMVHVVTGGGGAPLYDAKPSSWTAAQSKTLHFCVIDINGPELEMKVYEPSGAVIDHLVLSKPYSDEFLASAYPVERATYADVLINALKGLDLGSVEGEEVRLSRTLKVALPNPLEQAVNGYAEWQGGSNAWDIEPRSCELEIKSGGTADVVFELKARLPDVYPLPKLAVTVETGSGRVSVPPQTPKFHFRRLVQCGRLKAKPIIDGNVAEDEWKGAGTQEGFVLDTSDALSAKQSAFRVGYDAENLYLAFIFPEPEPDKLHAKADERDRSQVWMDDCVEVFIDPSMTRSDYYQFVVSASGAQYDSRNNDNSWNAEWKSAVQIGKDRWTCEAAIPFKAFDKAVSLGSGFNVCRNDNASNEYSQWTTTLGSSHRPELFGTLKFGAASSD